MTAPDPAAAQHSAKDVFALTRLLAGPGAPLDPTNEGAWYDRAAAILDAGWTPPATVAALRAENEDLQRTVDARTAVILARSADLDEARAALATARADALAPVLALFDRLARTGYPDALIRKGDVLDDLLAITRADTPTEATT